MDIHKRFNFDDPEDSYWNESSENNAEIVRNSFQAEYPNLLTNFGQSSFFDDDDDEEDVDEFVMPTSSPTTLAATTTTTPIANYQLSSNSSLGVNKIQEDFEKIHILERPNTNNASVETLTKTLDDETISDVQSLSDKSSAIEPSKLNNDYNSKMIVHCGTAASIVSDCSLGSYSSEMTVQLDYVRLKTEHKKLKKHFENIRNERYNQLPISETIKRLTHCQTVSLDMYRTKQEKIELLETALDFMDYDVIVTIILFLKRSLSNPIFREILLIRSKAAEYYVKYLKESFDFVELIDTLFALGRCEEAAMVEFTLACRKRQNDQKVQALKKCLVSGFSVSALSNEAKYVQEYINLLEKH